jgi:mRNA interferase YafQ
MKTVKRTSKFRKDYKRERKKLADLDEVLMPVIECLMKGEQLPVRLTDHALSGKWKDFRECHVKPDLLLIYAASDQEVSLARLGSHSELF